MTLDMEFFFSFGTARMCSMFGISDVSAGQLLKIKSDPLVF